MTWLDPPRRSEDVRSIPVDDDTVVFRVDTAAALSLEGTASVIWQLVDGNTSVQEAVDLLADVFDAPKEVVRNDVTALLDRLAASGFLAVADEAERGPVAAPVVLPDPPSP